MKDIYFEYGETEINYLSKKDKRMAEAIEAIGHITRTCDTDLYSSVIRHIVGQQISSKAQLTIWKRMNGGLGEISPASISAASADTLQSFGITFKKAEYIKDFAAKVSSGEFSLEAVEQMNDEDAAAALVSLNGVGLWTAEMILLFCLRRPNILSFGDLAIRRGLCLLYHHKEMNRERFERYRKRFSPYGSVASLYLWAVAGGALNRE